MGILDISKGWIFIVGVLWVIPWKIYSLWIASKRNEKGWFVALVILNTFAILEIIYIFAIAKKKPKDILNVLKRIFR